MYEVDFKLEWSQGTLYMIYYQKDVNNDEENLKNKGEFLITYEINLIPNVYHTDIGVTEELVPDEESYLQSMIGVLQWMVKVFHVYICCIVSVMSDHLLMSSKMPITHVIHIVGYLNKYHHY